MVVIRRWWSRHKLQALLTLLAVVGALLLRQSHGFIYFEAYRWLSQPFAPSVQTQERFVDAQVLELETQVQELQSQNQQFQALLAYLKTQPNGVAAPVIGRSADHWWQQIILGRGQTAGLSVGGIVTAPGGLLGRVTQVTPHTAVVLLLSDQTSRVGVTISRTGSMGYIQGQGSSHVRMFFFDEDPGVQVGDLVSTSPFSKLFPAGVPVGQVVSVDLGKNAAPQAVVELSVPISSVQQVVVTPFDDSGIS